MASSFSQQAPMNVESGTSLHIKPRTMDIRIEGLKLIVELIVDFVSFNLNGYPLWNFFNDKEWGSIFDMLNGPTYPDLVRDFWVRSEVYDATYFEVNHKITEDSFEREK